MGAATAVEDAAAMEDLMEDVVPAVRRLPSKKTGGVRKGGAGTKGAGKKTGMVQICRDCGQVRS